MSSLSNLEWCKTRWHKKRNSGNFCNFAEYDDKYEKVVVFQHEGEWKFVINREGRQPLWSDMRWPTPERAILAVAAKLLRLGLIQFDVAKVQMKDLTTLELRRIIQQNHPDVAEQYDLELYQRAVEEIDRRRCAA